MWEDPIVAEVRRTREKIFAQFDYDLDAFTAHIISLQEENKRRGVEYASPRVHHPQGHWPMQLEQRGCEHDDPIIAELDEVRAEILAEFGGDFDAYLDYLASLEAENRERGLRYADPRSKKMPRSQA
jgi:hypothetical protein